MVQQDRYAFLDNMKAIAIVMVVAIHAMAFSEDMPAQLKGSILVLIATIAVPVFFFIDGYLLAAAYASGKKVNYWDSVKKSSYRLLLPWLIFTCGYFLLRFIFEYFNLLDERHVIGRDFGYIVSGLYGSVYAGQMYFLISLFLVRLIAPIVSFIFNTSPLVVALLLCGLLIFVHGLVHKDVYKALYIPGGQEPLTHAIWGLQFYIVGVLAFRVVAVFNTKWWLLPSSIIFIASYIFYVPEVFQLAFLVFFFLSLKYLSFENTVMSYLGRNTMGIYLLHSPLILKLTALFVAYVVTDPLVVFLLNTSIATVLSLLSVYVVVWLGLSRYLFGEPKKRLS